jgi:DNA-binding MarR family transcriptional regulator
MLSSVLHSDRAVAVNIEIMRAFVRLRQLLAIKGFPGRDTVTVSELAERLQLRHHSTVELLDRLMDLKLVAREHSGADRRLVHVHLSAPGEKILDELSSAHEEQLRRIGPKLRTLLQRLSPGKD